MKPLHGLLIGVATSLALTACNSKNSATGDAGTDSSVVSKKMSSTNTTSKTVVPGTYVDLNTGKEVYIIQDDYSGYATDSIAKIPVEFYVNTSTLDTIYKTGVVVNHMLVEEDGKWKLDETKVKIDGDEIKMKDGDSKVKIDGDEIKVKDGDYKEKFDGDDGKIKDGEIVKEK